MNQEIGLIVGGRATTELATSALPDAPVRPVAQRGTASPRVGCWARCRGAAGKT
jgi:hypothetical protein